MKAPVQYEFAADVAAVTMDDGKVNALSPAMQQQLNAALDRAERDGAKAVVVAGNARTFSAGFDLSVFAAGDVAAGLAMVRGGFELAVRWLTFPVPVVLAVTGPAVAMGAMLLTAGDYRVGSSASRCRANEIAIGMTMPAAAVELMRMRLSPSAFQLANSMATPFSGEAAVAAGWLDECVAPDRVLDRARQVAAEAAGLNLRAHRASKLKARAAALAAIRAGIDQLPGEIGR